VSGPIASLAIHPSAAPATSAHSPIVLLIFAWPRCFVDATRSFRHWPAPSQSNDASDADATVARSLRCAQLKGGSRSLVGLGDPSGPRQEALAVVRPGLPSLGGQGLNRAAARPGALTSSALRSEIKLADPKPSTLTWINRSRQPHPRRG
jgi:hypothetical protein